MQHKAFSVLKFSKTWSVIMVQRAFRRRYGIDPPLAKNVRRWYKQFQETGCLYKGKSPGRPRTSQENVHRIQEAYQRSLRKSTRRASRQLTIPHVTVWRVLRRRLLMKPNSCVRGRAGRPASPTTNTARLLPRYGGKTRGCHCSHWAPDNGRENARNMLSCKQTSG